MSTPRFLVPGHTFLVRRVCTQRLGLLGCSPELSQILEYCLAFAARAAKLRIHAYCFFPTHYSLVVTDPQARLPEFTETFHSLVARCLNRHWKRREHFWAQGRPDHTLIPEREDILDLCAAVLLEPVESRMVRSPHAWPCASTLRVASKAIARPACFEEGEMPEVVQLRVESPEVDESRQAWAARVRRAVAEEARSARAWAAGSGPVLGAAAVRAMRPEDYVGVVVARRWGEVWAMAEEVIEKWFRKLAAFADEYREAARRFRSRLGAVFPVGTYRWRTLLRLDHGEGVALRTFPPSSPNQPAASAGTAPPDAHLSPPHPAQSGGSSREGHGGCVPTSLKPVARRLWELADGQDPALGHRAAGQYRRGGRKRRSARRQTTPLTPKPNP